MLGESVKAAARNTGQGVFYQEKTFVGLAITHLKARLRAAALCCVKRPPSDSMLRSVVRARSKVPWKGMKLNLHFFKIPFYYWTSTVDVDVGTHTGRHSDAARLREKPPVGRAEAG